MSSGEGCAVLALELVTQPRSSDVRHSLVGAEMSPTITQEGLDALIHRQYWKGSSRVAYSYTTTSFA